MSRLLTNTEKSLRTDYYSAVNTLETLKLKSSFTPLNGFEQELFKQTEISIKRIKIKLILKGIQV